MPFSIAIVGKTNVGKSTLLNMLCKKKFAIANNEPGVTRDRKEVKTEIAGRKVILVDTAGLEHIGSQKKYSYVKTPKDRKESEKDSQMYEQMIDQSIRAIKIADIVLFVVDAVNGVTEEDYHFADIARKANKKVVLIINKSENQNKIIITSKEIYKFGFKDTIFTSAEHAIGIKDILVLIKNELSLVQKRLDEESKIEFAMDGERMHIVIIGRPNSGKSTLVNKILNEDRVITGDKAGITRDAISIDLEILGRPAKLVDTAGIRKNNDKNPLEKLSIYETLRALRLAHVAILLIDATNPFVQQDLSLAGEILREGRILIVAINKSDLLSFEEIELLKAQLNKEIQKLVHSVVEPTFVIISAKTGEGLNPMYKKIINLYEGWNTKIKTNALNNWLRQRVAQNPPALLNGKEVKIKYIAQVKIRPPTFVIFVNKKDGISVSYLRYLANAIVKDFNLTGITVRISAKEKENPYVNNSNNNTKKQKTKKQNR